jgi:hypothetical protein
MFSEKALAQKLDRWSDEMLRVLFIYGCCRVIGEILLFVIRTPASSKHEEEIDMRERKSEDA